MATVVTIGRDIDGKPMDLNRWHSFREEVESAVRQHCADIYFVGNGVGHSERWGVEDAFTVVAGHIDELGLHGELARLGRFYGQEAVAVTQGETYFV